MYVLHSVALLLRTPCPMAQLDSHCQQSAFSSSSEDWILRSLAESPRTMICTLDTIQNGQTSFANETQSSRRPPKPMATLSMRSVRIIRSFVASLVRSSRASRQLYFASLDFSFRAAKKYSCFAVSKHL